MIKFLRGPDLPFRCLEHKVNLLLTFLFEFTYLPSIHENIEGDAEIIGVHSSGLDPVPLRNESDLRIMEFEGWNSSALGLWNFLTDHAEHGPCDLNRTIQILTAHIDLNGPSPAQSCLKDPCLQTDAENPGKGLNRIHKEGNELCCPLFVGADGAEKHDRFCAHIEHILNARIAFMLLTKIGLEGTKEIMADLFPLFIGESGRRDEEIDHKIPVPLGQIFHLWKKQDGDQDRKGDQGGDREDPRFPVPDDERENAHRHTDQEVSDGLEEVAFKRLFSFRCRQELL